MTKPSYDELALAFWTYLASTNNGGAPVAPTEDEVEAAYELLSRTETTNPYPDWPVTSG